MLGGLSEHFGLRLPLAGGAVVCLVLWVWAARLRPAMDRAFEGEPAAVRGFSWRGPTAPSQNGFLLP